MVCFTPNKRKKGKKEGYQVSSIKYGRYETLGRVSNFLFSGFCALGESKRLSFLDHGSDIYALAWAGRQ